MFYRLLIPRKLGKQMVYTPKGWYWIIGEDTSERIRKSLIQNRPEHPSAILLFDKPNPRLIVLRNILEQARVLAVNQGLIDSLTSQERESKAWDGLLGGRRIVTSPSLSQNSNVDSDSVKVGIFYRFISSFNDERTFCESAMAVYNAGKSIIDECITDTTLIELVKCLRESETSDTGYEELKDSVQRILMTYAERIVQQYREDCEVKAAITNPVREQQQRVSEWIEQSDREIRESKISQLLHQARAHLHIRK